MGQVLVYWPGERSQEFPFEGNLSFKELIKIYESDLGKLKGKYNVSVLYFPHEGNYQEVDTLEMIVPDSSQVLVELKRNGRFGRGKTKTAKDRTSSADIQLIRILFVGFVALWIIVGLSGFASLVNSLIQSVLK